VCILRTVHDEGGGRAASVGAIAAGAPEVQVE